MYTIILLDFVILRYKLKRLKSKVTLLWAYIYIYILIYIALSTLYIIYNAQIHIGKYTPDTTLYHMQREKSHRFNGFWKEIIKFPLNSY